MSELKVVTLGAWHSLSSAENALNEADEFGLFDATVSVAVDSVEELIDFGLIYLLLIVESPECRLYERENLFAVEVTAFVFVVIFPESINSGLNHLIQRILLFLLSDTIVSLGVSHLGRG